MQPIRQGIFRAYDIRGVVDRDFDAQWVQELGRALGTWFAARGWKRAVVGHDCRHSSPAYQEAMTRGLAMTGTDVLRLGQVPTPVFYYAARTLGYRAGVMITASHNPPEFNGFKVWGDNTTLFGEQIQEIYRTMAAGDFLSGRGAVSDHDIVPAYLDDLAGRVTLARPVTLVVDGGNGTGGEIARDLLERLGCQVHCIYCRPDGDFPNHHPDPVIEANVRDLSARVLETGADAGIGLDGDADRIGVVDETGRLMYGDQLLALYARETLKEFPGATVIGDVKCSNLLFEDIAVHGGTPLMWITGHSVVKAKMLETGARLAGEMSGHMFFADRYFGFDDAIYAAARTAQMLSRAQAPLSGMLGWPPLHNTPEIRMDCPEQIKFEVVRLAQEHFPTLYKATTVDGVRVEFDDGWGLLRASNTQPALVLRFEALTPQRLAEIRRAVETPLAGWIRQLSGQDPA
jgi:phosphomannomutase/phosphoglucomutase